MRTKVLFILPTCCVLALAGWFLHAPNPVQADEVPEKYRDTVTRGLEYLVGTQREDGHWEGDGGRHPVAMTGLAGLALYMEGGIDRPGKRSKDRERKYSASIRKAVDWLVDQSDPRRGGLIYSGHPSETTCYMQGHGWATLFLAGACENEKDPQRRKKLNDVLTRAVKYIANAQSTQGGWYHTSKMEGHDFDSIAATAIQIQALQAAEIAGIDIDDDALNDGQEYLKMAMGKHEAANALHDRGRLDDTAAALACRLNPFCKAGDEFCKKWFKHCQPKVPVGRAIQFGRDDLTHYYYALSVYNHSNARYDAWISYRTTMFDHLQSTQNKDGSWQAPSGSQEALGVGPVCTTALWCAVLQLDRQCHPSYRIVPVLTK
jgi:hypothetical protein